MKIKVLKIQSKNTAYLISFLIAFLLYENNTYSLDYNDSLNYNTVYEQAQLFDKWQINSLMNAAIEDNTASVVILLNSGANINAQNTGGATPLHLAARMGNSNTVNILLKNNANFEIRDNERFTPLMRAALSGDPTSVILLNNVASDTLRWCTNKNKQTALFLTAMSNCKDCAEAILSRKPQSIKYNALAKQEITKSLTVVRKKGNSEFEVMLEEYLAALENAKFEYNFKGKKQVKEKPKPIIIPATKPQEEKTPAIKKRLLKKYKFEGDPVRFECYKEECPKKDCRQEKNNTQKTPDSTKSKTGLEAISVEGKQKQQSKTNIDKTITQNKKVELTSKAASKDAITTALKKDTTSDTKPVKTSKEEQKQESKSKNSLFIFSGNKIPQPEKNIDSIDGIASATSATFNQKSLTLKSEKLDSAKISSNELLQKMVNEQKIIKTKHGLDIGQPKNIAKTEQSAKKKFIIAPTKKIHKESTKETVEANYKPATEADSLIEILVEKEIKKEEKERKKSLFIFGGKKTSNTNTSETNIDTHKESSKKKNFTLDNKTSTNIGAKSNSETEIALDGKSISKESLAQQTKKKYELNSQNNTIIKENSIIKPIDKKKRFNFDGESRNNNIATDDEVMEIKIKDITRKFY